MTKYPQIKSQDIIWQDKLDFTANVVENGGDIRGNVLIQEKMYVGDGAVTSTINYGDVPFLKHTYSEMTVGIRFKTTSTDTQYLFAKYFSAANGLFNLIMLGGNRVDSSFTNAATTRANASSSSVSYDDGLWHSLIGRYNGANVQIYFDGLPVDLTPPALTGNLFDTSESLYIGSNSNSTTNSYTGELKDAFISKRAYTDEEILDWHQQDTFQEIDDSKALYSVPCRTNYNDGADQVTENIGSEGGIMYLGDGTTSTTFPTQLYPKGFSYDGGDYLESEDSVSGMSGDFEGSMTALIKRSVTGSAMLVTSLGANSVDAGVSFGMAVDTVAGSLSAEFNSRTHRTAGDLISDDQWYHIAITKEAGTITAGTKLYINGEEVPYAATASGSPNLLAGPFNVGVWVVPGASEFTGSILHPRLFDFELTPTQVKEIARRDMKGLNK
jgi:hypothetical protein